jgi:hypothetical protein
MEPLWAPAPWPFFETRRRHKYRVKPGSATLVLSSLPLCLSLCSSRSPLPRTALPPPFSPSRPKSDRQKTRTRRPDELLARAKANSYWRGEHREQTKYDQDGALRRYVVYEGPLYSFTSPVLTQSSRWKLDEMREDAKRRGVTPSDERIAREHCLSKGVETPDLAAVKDFLRFQTSVMRGKSPLTALQSGSLAGSPV